MNRIYVHPVSLPILSGLSSPGWIHHGRHEGWQVVLGLRAALPAAGAYLILDPLYPSLNQPKMLDPLYPRFCRKPPPNWAHPQLIFACAELELSID